MKILVWGTGNTARHALLSMKQGYEITAFVESDAAGDLTYNGKVIIPPGKVKYIDFEYLIVCSLAVKEIALTIAQEGIDQSKVLYWKDINLFKSYIQDSFHQKLQRVADQSEVYGFITGISYHVDGIAPDFLKYNLANMAVKSQDLYTDYHIAKYIIDNHLIRDLRYAIIGLSYYSFEYDLSKSVNAEEVVRYFPEIDASHNLISSELWREWCVEKEGYLQRFARFAGKLQRPVSYELNYEEGERTFRNDFYKNYPNTIFENRHILRQYLELLRENQVKPVIVIMPATKYYYVNCGKIHRELFYHELKSTMGGVSRVQVLDYFGTLEIDDQYWYHVTHLNKEGAALFSKRLTQDIDW